MNISLPGSGSLNINWYFFLFVISYNLEMYGSIIKCFISLFPLHYDFWIRIFFLKIKNCSFTVYTVLKESSELLFTALKEFLHFLKLWLHSWGKQPEETSVQGVIWFCCPVIYLTHHRYSINLGWIGLICSLIFHDAESYPWWGIEKLFIFLNLRSKYTTSNTPRVCLSIWWYGTFVRICKKNGIRQKYELTVNGC